MPRMCTSQYSRDKSWHLGKQFLNISKFSPRHGTHYFTWSASPRIPTHNVTSSSLISTPNCVPWRKPFVVPLWSLLQLRPATDMTGYVHGVRSEREWWILHRIAVQAVAAAIRHIAGDFYTFRQDNAPCAWKRTPFLAALTKDSGLQSPSQICGFQTATTSILWITGYRESCRHAFMRKFSVGQPRRSGLRLA